LGENHPTKWLDLGLEFTEYFFISVFISHVPFLPSTSMTPGIMHHSLGLQPIINDSIKLKYKVTLLVYKPQSKSYISRIVFVINLTCTKNIIFIIKRNGYHTPRVCIRVTKKHHQRSRETPTCTTLNQNFPSGY